MADFRELLGRATETHLQELEDEMREFDQKIEVLQQRLMILEDEYSTYSGLFKFSLLMTLNAEQFRSQLKALWKKRHKKRKLKKKRATLGSLQRSRSFCYNRLMKERRIQQETQQVLRIFEKYTDANNSHERLNLPERSFHILVDLLEEYHTRLSWYRDHKYKVLMCDASFQQKEIINLLLENKLKYDIQEIASYIYFDTTQTEQMLETLHARYTTGVRQDLERYILQFMVCEKLINLLPMMCRKWFKNVATKRELCSNYRVKIDSCNATLDSIKQELQQVSKYDILRIVYLNVNVWATLWSLKWYMSKSLKEEEELDSAEMVLRLLQGRISYESNKVLLQVIEFSRREDERLDTPSDSYTQGEEAVIVECSICLEVVERDKVFALPCTHCFHKSCIEEWLEIRKICPLCKIEIGDSSSST